MRGRRRAGRPTPEIERAARLHGLRGPNVDGNYATCCPFCLERVGYADELFKLTIKVSGETKTTKIPLSLDSGTFNCYRCSTHGLGDFTWIAELVDVPDEAAPAPPPPDLGPPESFRELSSADAAHGPYLAYLRARGVARQAFAAGAGACTRGRFRGRIVYPVRAGGAWAGFSARTIEPVEPRYLYPEGMNRRSMLWGVEHLPPAGPVYVVEGVHDALPLFPHAVATFGKNVTDEQVDLIAGLGRPVVSCLDGDAWMEARALAGRLVLRGARAVWCHLPPGSDPGQLGWDVARHLVTT